MPPGDQLPWQVYTSGMFTYEAPSGHASIQTFLTEALEAGIIRRDIRGVVTVAALYDLYVQHVAPAEPASRNRFGRTLNALGSPSIKGSAGVRCHGGLVIN